MNSYKYFHANIFLHFFNTLLMGWYKTNIITKFAIPCIRSNGIPAIHQANPLASPLWMPPPANPMKKYGMEQSAPKHSPNIPERMANDTAEFVFLIFDAENDKSGQLYRYMTHQRPKPYMAPSIRMKTGIASSVRFLSCNVNSITQNVVNSTFGMPANTILQASMMATIMAMLVMSFVVMCLLCVDKLVHTSVCDRLCIDTIVAVFTVHCDAPISTVFLEICGFAIYGRKHDSVFTFIPGIS